ncbi:hypothetical protein N9937_01220 [bacterium]|nr:hypothetical protein [bacterium]
MNQLDRIESMLTELLAMQKPKRVLGTPQKRHKYDEGFEQAWKMYPKCANNNKYKAEQAWKARKADGVSPETMIAGLTKYTAYIKATGCYVKHAATFFGPAKHFNDDFTLPDPKDKKPQSQAEKEAWATARGFTPRAGESWIDYFIRAGVPR